MQADFHSPRRAYWKKRRYLTFGRVLSQLCPVFSRVLLQCKLTNLQKENHLCWSTSPPGALGKWPLYCGSSMCLTAVKSTSTPSSYAHQLCRRAVSTILIHPHSGFRRGRKMKTHYDRNAYKHESIIRNVNILLQDTGVIIPCRTWNNFLTSSQKAISQIWHQQEEPHCSPSASRGRLKELKMWITLPATLLLIVLEYYLQNPLSSHTVGLMDTVVGAMATAAAMCSSAMRLRRRKKSWELGCMEVQVFILQNRRDRYRSVSHTSLPVPFSMVLSITQLLFAWLGQNVMKQLPVMVLQFQTKGETAAQDDYN